MRQFTVAIVNVISIYSIVLLKMFFESIMIITSLISLIFIGHYLFFVVKKPKLICRNNKFRHFIQENCPIIFEKYWPTIWCYDSRLMSSLCVIFRSLRAPNINYQRESIQTPDGAILYLDHFHSHDFNNNKTDHQIILFLPGLTGSSSAEYIRSFVKIASNIGYHSIVLNARGTADNRLQTPRVYCCANDDDLRTCIKHLREKYPTNKIIGIGTSYGGIILSRYLSLTGDKAEIDAAFVISVCWDFIPNSHNIERWPNLLLNRYLTKALIRLVKNNEHLFKDDPKINLERVYSSKTLRQFDDEFTSLKFGFKNAYEYYDESSNNKRIHLIKRPTFCLNSYDDMFSLGSTLPIDKIENECNHVAMLITDRGGHIGWIDGLWPIFKSTKSYYLERIVEQYLRAFYNVDRNFFVK